MDQVMVASFRRRPCLSWLRPPFMVGPGGSNDVGRGEGICKLGVLLGITFRVSTWLRARARARAQSETDVTATSQVEASP